MRWWWRGIPLSPAVFARASWDPAHRFVKGFLAIGSRTTSSEFASSSLRLWESLPSGYGSWWRTTAMSE